MIITVSVVSFVYRRDCVWLLFIGSRDMIAKVDPIAEISQNIIRCQDSIWCRIFREISTACDNRTIRPAAVDLTATQE
jgi:hypothetical protein